MDFASERRIKPGQIMDNDSRYPQLCPPFISTNPQMLSEAFKGNIIINFSYAVLE